MNEPAEPLRGTARQAHSVFRRLAFAPDGPAATALSFNHLLAVMAAMMTPVVVVTVMPVADGLRENAAAAGHHEHESKKGTKLFHP